jgi:PKD repeat protein
MIASKSYDTAGAYNVTLTVTDDAGNVAVASQTVTVGTSSPGGLTAAFTFSPTSPASGTPVNFNASTSTGTISSYKWDFGDGSTTNTASKTTSHTYSAVGTFVVTLTVTSGSLTATTSQTLSTGP